MKTIFAGLVVLLICANGATQSVAGEAPSSAVQLASAPRLDPVHFRAGHPVPDEDLAAAVEAGGIGPAGVLDENLAAMSSVYRDGFGFRILGFASPGECGAEAACIALSERRARLVAEWLVANGLDEHRIRAVEAMGTRYLIGDETTEDGQRRNMRVELELVLPSDAG